MGRIVIVTVAAVMLLLSGAIVNSIAQETVALARNHPQEAETLRQAGPPLIVR
jgi:hypothetical protein